MCSNHSLYLPLQYEWRALVVVCFVSVLFFVYVWASPDGRVYHPRVAPEHQPSHGVRVASYLDQGLAAGAEHQHRGFCPPGEDLSLKETPTRVWV